MTITLTPEQIRVLQSILAESLKRDGHTICPICAPLLTTLADALKSTT